MSVKVLSDLLTRMAFWELVVTRKEGRPERTEVTIAPFRDIAPGREGAKTGKRRLLS